jgi:hypothetical protein
MNIFQFSDDREIRFHRQVKPLEEKEGLLRPLHHLVESLDGRVRILDPFIFSHQSTKRVPHK